MIRTEIVLGMKILSWTRGQTVKEWS